MPNGKCTGGAHALDRLVMVEADNEAALRSKRTIGILRQLFPEVSQIVEQKINMITSEVIRVLGPVILRSALGGGGGGGRSDASGSSGSTVTVSSPFGDDDSDDDGQSSSGDGGSRVSISLPTFPPDEEDAESASESSDVNPEAENQVGAESQNTEVRVQFADDQAGAAATNAGVEPALAPLDDVEVNDDNRNKRFLNFGFGAQTSAGGNAAGSGGGSGNFLFDIIRQTADGAARAAGTVYRVVAGTQSLGLGLSASRDVGAAPAPANPAPPAGMPAAMPPGPKPAAAPAAPPAAAPAAGAAPPAPASNGTSGPGLVAGSGSTEQGDAAANAPARGADATPEAVPGPITRLFVIANRGISNLIDDLILRLAATSERIVNFKARLITSII
ncbi:transcription initiation factor TFIID subunit 4 isoform X2 [Cephus cinctus]|uniref:Transcription initiation factor TFIID subunit 4 isoform X2 n=1 Tax=Cephus cinctus TaxID=211228 RepID=A0AAJ7FIH5_CEPCN|nr:transcription initiation factor TFIID subunit 4 isoform X2 [Cephus cinctus]